MLAFIILLLNIPIFCSEHGNDNNSGKSPETAVRTVTKALTISNNIRLRCGDTFYENIVVAGDRGAKLVIESYGNGPRPKICGLRWPGGRNQWKRVTEIPANATFLENHNPKLNNIWRIRMDNGSWKGYDTSGKFTRNNIGAIVNLKTGSLCGSKRVQHFDELSSDFEFWQPYREGKNSSESGIVMDEDACRYLYLYYHGDPNKLSIGVTAGNHGVAAYNLTRGLEVRNIEVCYWGYHGFSIGSHTNVSGCRVDAIGGSIQLNYPIWVQFGNGIEHFVNGTSTDILVSENIISRCFDAGITAQGSSSTTPLHASNIRFCGNLVFNCCHGWECFLRYKNTPAKFVNCELTENIFIDNGINSGFRYSPTYGEGQKLVRDNYSHILNNTGANDDFVVSNNTCIDGNYMCYTRPDDYSSALIANIVYIVEGQRFLTAFFQPYPSIEVPRRADFSSEAAYLSALSTAESNYRRKTGDVWTAFRIVPSSADLKALKQYYFTLYDVTPPEL